MPTVERSDIDKFPGRIFRANMMCTAFCPVCGHEFHFAHLAGDVVSCGNLDLVYLRDGHEYYWLVTQSTAPHLDAV